VFTTTRYRGIIRGTDSPNIGPIEQSTHVRRLTWCMPGIILRIVVLICLSWHIQRALELALGLGSRTVGLSCYPSQLNRLPLIDQVFDQAWVTSESWFHGATGGGWAWARQDRCSWVHAWLLLDNILFSTTCTDARALKLTGLYGIA
jgi:hypothetical protein